MGEMATNLERGAHLVAAYLDPTLGDLRLSQGEAHVLAQIAKHSAGREASVVLITDGQVGNEREVLRAFAAVPKISVHSFGIDTTVNGIGAAIYCLARFPDQWRKLHADPSLARAAFEEAVRLESPGPVLYRQRRSGLHGHEFEVLKLRTMVEGAEHRGAGLAISEDDARITRVGRLLRRSAIGQHSKKGASEQKAARRR